MDVIATAWRAAGCPSVLPATLRGRCARCGLGSLLTAVTEVVSSTFTGWDNWASPAGTGLCPACAWSYRTPVLRLRATMVTGSPPGLRHLPLAAVATALQQPLPAMTAVAVPLRPGRKHILPGASWGTIATGDANLTWGRDDSRRLQAVQRLRQAGFGSRLLTQAAPAAPVLRRLPPAQLTAVLDDWEALRPWRQRPPWLALALRVTTPGAA
jgi:hypothetical protein